MVLAELFLLFYAHLPGGCFSFFLKQLDTFPWPAHPSHMRKMVGCCAKTQKYLRGTCIDRGNLQRRQVAGSLLVRVFAVKVLDVRVLFR